VFRNVIVPLDTWLFAEHALPYGIAVARASGASLHLVHVHASPLNTLYLADAGHELEVLERDRESAYLDELGGRVRAATGQDVSTRLLDGTVTSALLAYAEPLESPLIVMATHGRGGLSRSWLGSSADHFLRHARSPVLLIRPSGEDPVDLEARPQFRHVMIALDGSSLGESILEPAAALGMPLGARYTLLRVAEYGPTMSAPFFAPGLDDYQLLRKEREAEAELYVSAVAQRLRESGMAVDSRVVAGLAARAVLDQAQELGADVIALATHGRGGATRMLLGSVADKIIRGASSPVLVVRPES
jgi:nucleotide-binding universal stress UspA family protein